MQSKDSYPKFVLASSSPRRRELLESVGLMFSVCAPEVLEELDYSQTPEDNVLRLAFDKAQAIARARNREWILAADTMVVLAQGDEWMAYGKPRDIEDARKMLRELSGIEHQVFTGFAWVHADYGVSSGRVVRTRVLFRDIDDVALENYLSTTEWSDKAGAYAIQGLGASLIDQIIGSYTNVIGLPVPEVLAQWSNLRN